MYYSHEISYRQHHEMYEEKIGGRKKPHPLPPLSPFPAIAMNFDGTEQKPRSSNFSGFPRKNDAAKCRSGEGRYSWELRK